MFGLEKANGARFMDRHAMSSGVPGTQHAPAFRHVAYALYRARERVQAVMAGRHRRALIEP